jgi:hypothetical protein
MAWWRLDDRVTPVALDAGPNRYHGTYSGGVTLNEPGIISDNPAAHFDGVQARVEVTADLDFDGADPFSVEAWVSHRGDNAFIAGKLTYVDSVYRGWMLVWKTDGFVFQRVGNSGADGGRLLTGGWHHVVGTFDGVTARLYVNGVEEAVRVQDTDLPVVGDETPFRIGREPTWAKTLGWIDEVALYDYALPASRIQAHYDAGAPR